MTENKVRPFLKHNRTCIKFVLCDRTEIALVTFENAGPSNISSTLESFSKPLIASSPTLMEDWN